MQQRRRQDGDAPNPPTTVTVRHRKGKGRPPTSSKYDANPMPLETPLSLPAQRTGVTVDGRIHRLDSSDANNPAGVASLTTMVSLMILSRIFADTRRALFSAER